jgi:hypothetical protein
VPLVLLVVAAACVLVGLRMLPDMLPSLDAQRTAVIANDTAAAVTVSRDGSGERVTLAPGRDLRAGPGGSSWVVEDPAGRRLGCLVASPAGARLPVSRAGPCRA